tara:strand:+ start:3257 stop:3874 length:618 start_codon:yes stop_codon:yes gene_type:complete
MVKTTTKKTETPAATDKTASKKKVVKKTVAPKKEETPVVETAPVVEEAEKTEDNSLMEQSSVFFAKLQNLTQAITALKSEFRGLEKKWVREIKASQKVAKKKRKNANRAPSGFVKPTRISDDLAEFLGVQKGVEMARTDVTKEITNYIRQNNLQDKDNGRKINPDTKLSSLLNLQKEDVLTYFNLQKYMSPHFAKSVKAVVGESA